MSNTVLGLVVGLVLGVAAAFGGFGAFLVVLVLGAVGLLVGRWLDGALDLDELTGRGRSRSGPSDPARSDPARGTGPRVRL